MYILFQQHKYGDARACNEALDQTRLPVVSLLFENIFDGAPKFLASVPVS
jgi:hypothetical protein